VTDIGDLVRASVRAMRGYVPGEQPRDRRYIKLNTNENPYPPSPRVIEALIACATDSVRLYPDPDAAELRHKAAEVYGLLPEQILAGNGSDDLLNILFRACTDPSSRAAYAVPTYSLYDVLGELTGCQTVRIPYPDDFSLPVQRLLDADARLTIVCSPNAPSGTFTPIDVVEDVVRRARGLVVVDEAYVDFAAANALPLVSRYDNVVILRTFSKSYSLAGMRIGLAFGHARVISELVKVKDSYNLNRASLAAATAALSDQAWMQDNARKIRTSRAVLVEGLRSMGYVVPPSEANFVLARRPGKNLGSVYQCLKGQGVLVRYFDTPDLADALRISVGLPEENQALLAALAKCG
jgi:histidinol-phosphate aminotransferase